jgi:glycosyltransferase involved in cell wall biosynthesis
VERRKSEQGLMPSLSVVMPAWNEEANVGEALEQVSRVLQSLDLDYEIILVKDGSRDRTGEIAKSLIRQVPHLKLVEHYPNRGYGGALKAGFAQATKDLIAFVPSDNQFDFSDIRGLLAKIDGAAIVSGYRADRQDPLIRKVNAFGWNLVVRLLFGYLARDIDCGFKVFRREILDRVTLDSNGAMIDTELLAGARARGYKVAELPVRHLPRVAGHPTGANLRVIVRAFRDLFRFRLRLSGELRAEAKSAEMQVRGQH